MHAGERRRRASSLALALVLVTTCLAGLGAGAGAGAGAAAAPPTVTQIAPNNGAERGQTRVSVTGTGFLAGATVRFGAEVATGVEVESATRLSAQSPAGAGLQAVSVSDANGTSPASTADQYAYDPPPNPRWLGLNNATAKYLGWVGQFALHGIVYDRSFEIEAGRLPSEDERGTETAEFERRLREDHEYGMTPVVTIEYRGYSRQGYAFASDPEFPQARGAREEAAGKNTIGGYVEGFVRTASAVLSLVSERYPGMRVLLEPMNEPWGYTTPQFNGGEYADVIAALLPAAAAAQIPAGDIYVAATGRGWVPAMYGAQPRLGSEIEGWYLHPYGPPAGVEDQESEGIQSLPLIQAAMTSGQNNIIVSEVGYCAEEVNNPTGIEGGVGCHGFSVKDSTVAASDLSGMLGNSRPYQEAGWLRALIVYSRNDGGWAMQSYPELTLTKSGEALEAFADVESRGRSTQAPLEAAQEAPGSGRELFESGIPEPVYATWVRRRSAPS